MMLREVYVMHNGVDIFHYSAGNVEDDDEQFMLTSGFFAALQSFSEEVRSSKINLFSSENELFLFDELEKEDTTLVIVCDNTIQQSVAREILRHVKITLDNSVLIDTPSHYRLEEKEERQLREEIHNVAQSLISVEFQVEAAKEIFSKRADIDQVLIYDYNDDKLHVNLVSDKINPVEKDQLLAIRSFQRNIIPFIKEFQVGTNFDFILIETFEYILLISKHSTIYTIVYALDPEEPAQIRDIPFRMMSRPGYTYYNALYEKMNHNTTFQIDRKQNIKIQDGSIVSLRSEKMIGTFLQYLNKLLSSFEIDSFQDIIIFPSLPAQGYIKFSRNFTRGLRYIEIFKGEVLD